LPAASKLSVNEYIDQPAVREVLTLAETILPAGNRRAADGLFWVDAVDDVLIVAVTNVEGEILYANQRFCAISGYSTDELIGANHRILNSGEHDSAFFGNMFRTIKSGRTWRGEICNRAKSGRLYWVATTIIPRLDEAGAVTHYVACRFDITEQKRAQMALAHAANTDALTGLCNRFAFQKLLEQRFTPHHSISSCAAIAMIDIDSFKDINDIYGHQTGDELLKILANRIAKSVAIGDVVARFGGDEMIVLFDNIQCDDDLRERLARLQATIQTPMELEGVKNQIFASIGVARYPIDGTDTFDLIKKADMALYDAKRLGRNRHEFYSKALQHTITRRVRLQEEARLGLLRGEFELYYQPILNLHSGHVDSMEALLRWQHPTLGLISPGQFWEVFSDLRLTAAIGKFVRETAVKQAVEWTYQAVPFGRIAVNTTSADYARLGLCAELAASLKKHGLPNTVIAIEVTEGMFLGKQAQRVREELALLNEAGFEIAFDDFGTGFASLTHLKELPLDRIKIDRSFIKDMEQNDVDRKIVKGVIDLAHSLELIVTAEGIEDVAQLQMLRDLGCDKIQGYLVSHPVQSNEIPAICYRHFSERDLGAA
jgi:diguanylate cyclase (GGDEF)-like protein/PAS domain S-box-containing protein